MNQPLTPVRSLKHSPTKVTNNRRKTVNTPTKSNNNNNTNTDTFSCNQNDLLNSPSHDMIVDLLELNPDEDDAVVELLRCESSPIYASRPSSVLGKRGVNLHAPSSPIMDPCGFWVDVERNLRFMDRQNEASFTDWIRNERNLTLSLPHIKRVMFDYAVERVINGLRWLIFEWRLASIATTIKYLLIDDIWSVKSDHQTDLTEFDLAHCLCVAGQCYSISKIDFRNRIRIVMALIDGWTFEHVRELFHFLCSASCHSTSQSAFLLQALLLAFPEGNFNARKLKRQLIESFMFN